MNILYSAFECNPNRGSEAYCGWSWIINMRKYHNIFVITRKENRREIEDYCKSNNIDNIKFFYCDINDKFNLYYKYGKFYMQYYVLWQKRAYKLAKKIVNEYPVDIIHHITLGDFRVIGNMWKLNKNFIFGPVGGAQYIPKSLEKYAQKHRYKELYRKTINEFKRIDIRYKIAIKHTQKIFCANEETMFFLKKIIKNADKYQLLTENGINQVFYKKGKATKESECVNIIWMGRIVYRKGLEFLVDVIPLINTNRKFKIYIYGNDQGNEVNFLKEKAKKYGIEDKILFKGKIEHSMVGSIYQNADLFVFPSLRETTGTVVFEAMSHGLPVIGFKQNGIKLITSEKSSILIDINDDEKNIKINFANAMKKLIENDEIRQTMSDNAIKEIQEYYWKDKAEYMNNIYLNIVNNKGD